MSSAVEICLAQEAKLKDTQVKENAVRFNPTTYQFERWTGSAWAPVGSTIDESNIVHKTGDETISGTKTFNSTIVGSVYGSYLSWGGRDISGDISPLDAACIDDFGHNKAAFLPPSCIKIERTTDGGSTWSEASVSDSDKTSLVTTAANVYVATGVSAKDGTLTNSNAGNYKMRITLSTRNSSNTCVLYCDLKTLLVHYNTLGASGNACKVEYRRISDYNEGIDNWETWSTYPVSGWSGWNSLPTTFIIGGSPNQTSQIAEIRLTFGFTGVSTSYVSIPSVVSLRFIGTNMWTSPSTMASTGQLYTFDMNQNATFPGNVSALGNVAISDSSAKVATTQWAHSAFDGVIKEAKDAANAAQSAADASVKTVNGNTPDVNGNISPEQTGCLPLSGGTMTGNISFSNNGNVGNIFVTPADASDWSYIGLVATCNDDELGGSFQAFTANSPNHAGGFTCRAEVPSRSCDLYGTPDGVLQWDGHDITHVIETWVASDSTCWYRKWSDGWLEQGGRIVVNPSEAGGYTYHIVRLTYPTPFKRLLRWQCQASHDCFTAGFAPGSAELSSAEVYQKNTQGGRFTNPFVIWYACGY